MEVYPSTIDIGYQSDGYLSAEGEFCTSYSQTDCSGDQYNSGGVDTYSWQSEDNSTTPISGASDEAGAELYGQAMGGGGANVFGSSNGCQASGGAGATVIACPSSVSLVTVKNASLSSNYPPYRTGIGGFAEMSVGTVGSTTYNGLQLTETLTQDAATTCPAKLLSEPAFSSVCSGSSTFTVGSNGGTQFDVSLGQINDAFWDQKAEDANPSCLYRLSSFQFTIGPSRRP
jgi:hypothetical protein